MKKIGDIGEVTAIKYLQKHKFEICDTNFRFGRFGEIDVIAKKLSRYYFIEVKYREHLGYGLPEEAIIPSKLRKCMKTMDFFCAKNNIGQEDIQFDVIAILKKAASYQITHYKNIEL